MNNIAEIKYLVTKIFNFFLFIIYLYIYYYFSSLKNNILFYFF